MAAGEASSVTLEFALTTSWFATMSTIAAMALTRGIRSSAPVSHQVLANHKAQLLEGKWGTYVSTTRYFHLNHQMGYEISKFGLPSMVRMVSRQFKGRQLIP